jgi:hypothetical protein
VDTLFHLSFIDIRLRKESTCPVCRLPLKNSSERKHARPVTFTMNQPLDKSTASKRNTDIERQHEPTVVNSIQPTSGKSNARQWSKIAKAQGCLRLFGGNDASTRCVKVQPSICQNTVIILLFNRLINSFKKKGLINRPKNEFITEASKNWSFKVYRD